MKTSTTSANFRIAEETSSASWAMPRSIMWSTYANAFLGLIMVITLIFTMGDLNEIINTATGYPFIQVFYNATGSRAGTTVMTLLIILPLTGSVIACIATASRQIWSFARDNGVPFSSVIRHVSDMWLPQGLSVRGMETDVDCRFIPAGAFR